MKIKHFIIGTILISTSSANAQTFGDVWNSTKDAAKNAVNTTTTNAVNAVTGVITGTNTSAAKPSLSNDEVIKGLKEALSLGTNNSSGTAAKVDGYLKNPKLFIPWPAEAQAMKDKLIKMGMKKKVADFETSLNRAAEEAAKKAAPVFLDAITNMSIGDGFAILKGADTAATHYLKEKTYAPLKSQFMPIVKEAINKVKVTSYWKPLATAYNKVPGVKKQNPDLNEYVCAKAIDGLMLLIQEEEMKIRKDPAARVTDLLKKVFSFK